MALQPFAGCKWTARLRRLSNLENHRRLLKTIDASSAGGAARYAPKIAFEEGGGLIETLEALAREVTGVVESFAPDFAGASGRGESEAERAQAPR
jgi:hypothetical protein